MALCEVAIPRSVSSRGNTIRKPGYGRLVTNLLYIHSHIPPLRSYTPSRYRSISIRSCCPSLNTQPCLGLQKVVRHCFSVLNSPQISYGERLSMKIWNLLEWRLWILIPLFQNTSEFLVFTCRLSGVGRGWVGSSLGGSATLRVPEQWSLVPSVSHGGESHVMWVILTRSRTQGGIFTTPGDAYTTPVDMWVKALGEQLFFFIRGTKPQLIKFVLYTIGIESFHPSRVSPAFLFALFCPLQIFFWRKLAEIMKSRESNPLAALRR